MYRFTCVSCVLLPCALETKKRRKRSVASTPTTSGRPWVASLAQACEAKTEYHLCLETSADLTVVILVVGQLQLFYVVLFSRHR